MIADQYLQLRSELESALGELLKLGAEMRRPAGVLDTLHALIADLRDPFLFVVMGEVKSGKSSLLNALFGQEFAKADVLPATDRVCIFRYAEQEKTVEVSPQLSERYLSIPLLRDFNVVDTPGTNTMVEGHQAITENFIPRADVILFVFSVANPWTQSAWNFLELLQAKWLKNVVFVLQQIDLREPSEIEIIRRHLQDTAMRRLKFVPPIFAVSARKALLARTGAGDKEQLWRESHFGPLEEQIDLIVTESSTRILKLRSTVQTGRVMLDEFTEQLRKSVDVISRDEARLSQVDMVLESRKEQTSRQVAGFLRGVEQACRDAVTEGVKLLEKKLSFWQTWKLIFGKGESPRNFQTEVEAKLKQTIQPQVEHAVRLLESDLRGLWPQLHDMLDDRLGTELRQKIPQTTPDFARQRRELLQSIELALMERTSGRAMEQLLTEQFGETTNRLRVPLGVAAAGGIATAIAAASSAAIADVTGILAISAATLGTVLIFTQRRKIVRAYEEQMKSKCAELLKAIEQQLLQTISLFYKEVSNTFQPLAAFCVAQRRIYEPHLRRAEEIQQRFDSLKTRIG
jgi:GTPase SAR1 family protein